VLQLELGKRLLDKASAVFAIEQDYVDVALILAKGPA
jgi:hypothetical protein